MSLRPNLFLAITLAATSLYVLSQARTEQARTPVLVELFTSEGCSSCPPADALLARMAQMQPVEGAQIIVLGEHIDYWDGLGWRDRFSSSQYTARQRDYGRRFLLDSVYTPQMVVDGAVQFVGNDQQKARQAVQEAVKRTKVPMTLSKPQVDGAKISASVSALLAAGAKTPPGDVYAALVDPVDTTDVRRGENSGKKLTHVSVVRTLLRVGSMRDLTRGPIAFHMDSPAGADVATMQMVVFAQQEGAGQVLGAVVSGGSTVAVKDGLRAAGESSGR